MSETATRANGKVVRDLRQKRGWTQECLARKVGCAKRTIENVESEKPVLHRIIHDVAQALEVSPEELRRPDSPLPPPTTRKLSRRGPTARRKRQATQSGSVTWPSP